MPHRINFSAQSAAAARAAAHDLAQLRKSLRMAQDSVAGLSRSARIPHPHGGRRTTPATRSKPSFFESLASTALGNFAAGGILFESGVPSRLGSSFGHFYASDAQAGSLWADITQQGQRVK